MAPMSTHTPVRLRALGLLAALALIGAACGSDDATDDATATDETTATATDDATTSDGSDGSDDAATDGDVATADPSGDADTTAGIETALWSDNVTIELGDGTFRFVSNGIPSHELPDEFLVPMEGSFTPPVTEDEVSVVSTDVAVVESPIDVDITLNPVYSDTPTDTGLGIIGVAISGAQLFNDYEDQDREFVAVDDAFSIDGVGFVDSCNGHPLALNADGTGQGDYHYHGVPYCITDDIDVDGEHSTILGVVLDGFPFYGPQDEGGVIITSDDLDECSGHVGPTPEFPEGIYHYHLTEDRSPYTIDCYHGEIDAADSGPGAGGPPPGG